MLRQIVEIRGVRDVAGDYIAGKILLPDALAMVGAQSFLHDEDDERQQAFWTDVLIGVVSDAGNTNQYKAHCRIVPYNFQGEMFTHVSTKMRFITDLQPRGIPPAATLDLNHYFTYSNTIEISVGNPRVTGNPPVLPRPAMMVEEVGELDDATFDGMCAAFGRAFDRWIASLDRADE